MRKLLNFQQIADKKVPGRAVRFLPAPPQTRASSLLRFLGITDVTFVRAKELQIEGVKETVFEKGVAYIAID